MAKEVARARLAPACFPKERALLYLKDDFVVLLFSLGWIRLKAKTDAFFFQGRLIQAVVL